jgi:toxin ParE1/3/4
MTLARNGKQAKSALIMMLKVTRTPQARLDLIEIWSYIADDSETSADRLLLRIDEIARMLSEQPFSGRARPELHPEIRSFPIGNYVLFYRIHAPRSRHRARSQPFPRCRSG